MGPLACQRRTFARSNQNFVAGARLSQGAASTLSDLGDSKTQKALAPCMNSAPRTAQSHLACHACTEAGLARSRRGLGMVPETSPLARLRKGFARIELRGKGSSFARISWQVQGAGSTLCEMMKKTLALCVRNHLGCGGGVRSRNGPGDGSLARPGESFARWQEQCFRIVTKDFAAGDALSQGQV